MLEGLRRNILPRLFGVALLAEAAVLGVVTVDAVAANQPRPEGLVFQDLLHRAQHSNHDTPYSHFELLNGFAANVVATGGLARAGLQLVRGRGGQSATEGQG